MKDDLDLSPLQQLPTRLYITMLEPEEWGMKCGMRSIEGDLRCL